MPKPILYDLFWRAPHRAWDRPVALGPRAILREPFPMDAVILYPAFLTPEVLQLEGDDDWFELVLATFDMRPEALVPHVNARLQVQVGLDPRRRARFEPLFADPSRSIEVKKLEPVPRLRTDGGFRGMLHPTFELPEQMRFYYQVRIRASCLAQAAQRAPLVDEAVVPDATPVSQDWQDRHLHDVLDRLNGPELRHGWGWGHHCFRMDGGHLDLGAVDPQQPLRAYHPLFVYQKGVIGHFNLGHVSDIHLNARQVVLAQSTARVIDAAEGGGGGDGLSPPIGPLVNVYSSSFSSILASLEAAGADLLLVGGDLVDHAHNCWPYFEKGAVPASDAPGNPAKIWGLMSLKGKSYKKYYQAYVDMLSFYSIIRDYIASTLKPVFVVSGNHDAYQEAFGISPRVLKVRANPGIPADHNLTMYEAILAFGETYGTIRKNFNFRPEVFRWLFNVLTPFSDYAVPLPKQRLVALHWGEAENMLDMPGTNHGLGHLPRAKQAVSDGQRDLARDGFGAAKKTVLFSHFTFVSYDERVPSLPYPVAGTTTLKSSGFDKHDMGTFDLRRDELYAMAESASEMQCVFTGHSHRKGLYLVAAHGEKATTVAYPIPMAGAAGAGAGRAPPRGVTPIIVSDCAGPLPRLNLFNEFFAWGSDCPSGTLARVDEAGAVREVLAIGATSPRTKPRLAVALEHLQVLQESSGAKGAVFGDIETSVFFSGRPSSGPLTLRFPLGEVFERIKPLRLAGAVLCCKPGVKTEWVRLPLALKRVREVKGDAMVASFDPGKPERKSFVTWLTAPGAGRFMSLTFALDVGPAAVDAETWRHLERYDLAGPWNFEADCMLLVDGFEAQYRIVPRFEAPNFEWRRKFEKYQA